jgi:hypothetical protein
MSGVHRINLSTAWRPPAAGSATWVRRFGRPAGLEPSKRVWLVFDGDAAARLILNGNLLPAGDRHDVTTALAKRNELQLEPQALTPVAKDGAAGQPAHGRRPLDPRLGRLHLEIVSDHP